MFSRKQQKKIRRYVLLAVSALVINVIYPAGAHARSISRSDTTGNSHTVIVQERPSAAPAPATLSKLPGVKDKPVTKKMVVRASAYSSTVDQTDSDPFTTASGAKVHDGTVAINGLPFGTKVRIPSHYGDKIFTVEDRMHAKWGTKRVDIWMPTRHDAIQWGVRTITLEVLS